MNSGEEIKEFVNVVREPVKDDRAALAIDASAQAIFDVDLKANRMHASKRLAEIFDVEENADRESYLSAIHPDDLALRDAAYNKALQTGTFEYEARVARKNGDISWIRVKGKIYSNTANEPERLIGLVQEITREKEFAAELTRKTAERTEELREANRQLRMVNDELEQFAYVSSHDLQEPLRKIRIFSDMLSVSVEKNNDNHTFIQKIRAAAERMSGLIHGLLEFSRVTNARLRFEKVDLNVLLKNILADYELLIEQKEAVVEVDDLPMVEGVQLQINQLFFNLVGNALKFTKRGAHPRIHIHAAPLADADRKKLTELAQDVPCSVITVQDNGIGFEQAFADQIFTVFQRLNDRSSFGGYGIGLALCKKVVQAHKGLIFAEGKLMKGAKFTVILPNLQYEKL